MRIAYSVLLLTVSLAPAVSAEPRDVRDAVRAALSWHYRWISSIPAEGEPIRCSVYLFSVGQSFGFCQPDSLLMNIVKEKGEARVRFMVRTYISLEEALAEFRLNINRSPERPAPVSYSYASTELDTCIIDEHLTGEAASMALSQETKARLFAAGYSLRYPVICKGSPFYLLYILTGKTPAWLELYDIVRGRFELRWSFEAGNEQRAIPAKALANLEREELWHKAERGR